MPSLNRATRKLRKIKVSEIEARQEQVGRLYCQGFTQLAIGQKLSISQPTVCNDLVAIRERWKENAQKDYVTRLNEELAKLDAIEEAAWESYRKSCQEAVTVTTEKMPISVKPKKGDEAGKPSKRIVITKSVEQRKGQAGDASFLSIADKCVEKRMKLLGFLDESAKIINNNTNQVADFSTLFVRKDDPALSEKRAPVIQAVDDPLEIELKRLEEQAGVQREAT